MATRSRQIVPYKGESFQVLLTGGVSGSSKVLGHKLICFCLLHINITDTVLMWHNLYCVCIFIIIPMPRMYNLGDWERRFTSLCLALPCKQNYVIMNHPDEGGFGLHVSDVTHFMVY